MFGKPEVQEASRRLEAESKLRVEKEFRKKISKSFHQFQMINKAYVNHVALVLPDVEFAANELKKYNFKIGETDLFESMGTKEIFN